jgi:hypothetical protein
MLDEGIIATARRFKLVRELIGACKMQYLLIE